MVFGGITTATPASFGLLTLRGVEAHIVARDILVVHLIVGGRNYLNNERFFILLGVFEVLFEFKFLISLLCGIELIIKRFLLLRRRLTTTTTHSSDSGVEIRAINLGFFNVRSALVR